MRQKRKKVAVQQLLLMRTCSLTLLYAAALGVDIANLLAAQPGHW